MTLTLLITGRVQGVWYRASAQAEARRLGVRGWVRNLPDGEVEARVEGEREAVNAFVAWCRRGPPNARVDDVDVSPAEASEPLTGFTVR